MMIGEASELSPESLFSSCSSTPIAMIFGTYDNPEALRFHRDRIPEKCEERIYWYLIPLSGHMYGTETTLIGPIGFLYTRISLSLLNWRINYLLDQQS
jgi:hypothetical protein